MTGGEGNQEKKAHTVEIYWADGQFPGKDNPNTGEGTKFSLAADNATPYFAEEDAHEQSAFDRALDRETGNATQTWAAHSAGTSKLGTAEKYGLTSDKILYLAPAGTGHDVSSVDDTASPNADRAVIQSRTDAIDAAQWAGGDANSGEFSKGDPVDVMKAKRLEDGFLKDGRRVQDTGQIESHNAIFEEKSTSMENSTAFIYGQDVIPYQGNNPFLGDALKEKGIESKSDLKAVPYDEVFDED